MLTIDPTRPQPALRMPWRNGIAVGRAYDLLRADLLDHLAVVQRELGFRTCRFHAVFDDDMQVVVKRGDGTLAYQWHHVDKVYDSLLALGLKPFVELNPMPKLLASGTQTMFHYQMNVTPPAQWAQWEDLCHSFARHLIDRYGLEEVSSWWFEVWNEPNLGCFWSGSKEDYWQLYDHAARGVKRAHPSLRIGGPATSKANWVGEMITHCVESGVPLDFVSTHLYPQDEYVAYPGRVGNPHQRGMFFIDTVREVQALVRASARPDLPIHWTEWNAMSSADAATVDWSYNPTNDSLYGAGFVTRTLLELDDAADTMCWWVASDIFDEGGIPSSPYSMTYGLLTIHGIPKASYNAFRLLRRMSGAVLPIAGALPPGAVARATNEDGVMRVLLANQIILDAERRPWAEQVRVPVAAGTWRVLTSRIRSGAGSAYETWMAMGRPHSLAPSEEAVLRAHATPEWTAELVTAKAGAIELSVRLEPGEVLYVEIRPPGEAALPRSVSPEDLAKWDAGMGERSR